MNLDTIDRLQGIGLSANPREAAQICAMALKVPQSIWGKLAYLSLGLDLEEPIPPQLPELLRSAGLRCTVHLLDVNFVKPFADQSERIERLVEKARFLDPVCLEEDLGLWTWKGMKLLQHMIPPIFDAQSQEIIAENIRWLQQFSGVPFLAENPPISFVAGDIDLLTFMAEIGERSGCGLVFDVGHYIGYCLATERDPADYFERWNGASRIREIHVSGYEVFRDVDGPIWYDMHQAPIQPYSIELIKKVLHACDRSIPVTLEQEGASFRRIAEHITLVDKELFHDR